MTEKPLIILGSSRKASDTGRLVRSLFTSDTATIADLLDYTISHYNYDHAYPAQDTYLELVELMLQHQKIVFATPVYWYAMSGLMKVFFDRTTDIVTVKKEIGRKMKGKETYLLAVGAEEVLPEGFQEPFRLTSAYLDMTFQQSFYCRTSEINVKGDAAAAFLESISAPVHKY
ncbi:NAD(P)H-dependent FMN-containing oxidoreductase ywqN [Pontibacter sp. HJ8]